MMAQILVTLKQQGVETLIIDNAEAVEFYPIIQKFEFVVAVFSSCATAIEKVPRFIKKRGDGNSTGVYFRPLCVEWCEKLLEKFGCKVEKEEAENSSLPLKQLDRREFLGISYGTGGVSIHDTCSTV